MILYPFIDIWSISAIVLSIGFTYINLYLKIFSKFNFEQKIKKYFFVKLIAYMYIYINIFKSKSNFCQKFQIPSKKYFLVLLPHSILWCIPYRYTYKIKYFAPNLFKYFDMYIYISILLVLELILQYIAIRLKKIKKNAKNFFF